MRILFSTIAKVLSTKLTNFIDNFYQRSDTTGGLGTSTSGEPWTAVAGTINVVSGAAKASSVPTGNSSGSAYPISTVEMGDSDVDIKLKGTNQGSSAAIWVQSSDDWWMASARGVLTEVPGNTNYGAVGSNYGVVGYTWTWAPQGLSTYAYEQFQGYYQYSIGVWSWDWNYVYVSSTNTNYGRNYSSSTSYTKSTNYASSGYFYGANYGTRYNSKYSIAYTKYTWGATAYAAITNYTAKTNYAASGYNSANAKSYSTDWGNQYYYLASSYSGQNPYWATAYQYFWYNYNATTDVYGAVGTNYGATGTNATTYNFSQYLDIRKSTGSVVSTVTSALVSTTQTIGSILISIVGNQITAKAFSDTNLVQQIGSDLVYTATGATITTNYGISVSPSDYQQSDIIASAVEITTT